MLSLVHFISHESSVDFGQGGFLKLLINSDSSFELKLEQKIVVNCLLEEWNVFAVMATGFGKSFSFQLFSTAIKQKIWEGEHPNSVILVIGLLISLIEDQIKEGQTLGLTCALLQDVNDIFGDNPLPQLLFAFSREGTGQ